MRIFAFIVYVACLAKSAKVPLFFAFGDWGEPSGTMRQVVSRITRLPRPAFVALLGDSFYPKGVRSVDDEQFRLFDSFFNISDHFLVTLGNHDYGYPESVPSLIAYSAVDPKWVLPSAYYMRKVDLDNGFGICLFVLDTHSFGREQLAWLEKSLRGCQEPNMYRIILTHYPLLTVGIYANSSTVARLRSQIVPLIDRYGVHAYISGHEHQMQAFEFAGVHYIVSGATAQMDRKKGIDTTKWRDELKFANDRDAAVAVFSVNPKDGSSLFYEFVRATDGKVMYASQIPTVRPESRLSVPLPESKSIPQNLTRSQQVFVSERSTEESTSDPLSDLADKRSASVSTFVVLLIAVGASVF